MGPSTGRRIAGEVHGETGAIGHKWWHAGEAARVSAPLDAAVACRIEATAEHHRARSATSAPQHASPARGE